MKADSVCVWKVAYACTLTADTAHLMIMWACLAICWGCQAKWWGGLRLLQTRTIAVEMGWRLQEGKQTKHMHVVGVGNQLCTFRFAASWGAQLCQGSSILHSPCLGQLSHPPPPRLFLLSGKGTITAMVATEQVGMHFCGNQVNHSLTTLMNMHSYLAVAVCTSILVLVDCLSHANNTLFDQNILKLEMNQAAHTNLCYDL